VWFQRGGTPEMAEWGVWQKTHIWVSVVAFTGPGPDTERLCFVLTIVEASAPSGPISDNITKNRKIIIEMKRVNEFSMLSFRLVRNLSLFLVFICPDPEGFPTRFACGNDIGEADFFFPYLFISFAAFFNELKSLNPHVIGVSHIDHVVSVNK
jgi:hypothetical protein